MGCAESKNETRVEADWNSEYGKRADAEMKKKRMSLARQRELFQSQDNIAFVDNKVQTVNGYTLGKVLGKGAYGEVFLAHKGGDKFAIKVLKNLKGKNLSAPKLLKRPGPPGGPPGLAKGSSKSSFDSVQTEIATMRKIMHPNLVHMFDVVVDIARSEVYVVLEFVDGGASQRMDKDGNPIPLAEETMWSHTRHLLLGLEFLHMQGIVHRDIKPENLLLTKDGMLKIADFGTARIMEDEEAGAKGTVGTPFFFSPEMCVKGAQGTFDGRAVDLWAVGVTMFVWTSGQMPFSAPTEYMLMESIREAPAQVAPPSGASVSLGAVVSGLLTKEPSKRLTLNQLRLHPWLTQEGKKPVPQQPVVKIEVTDDDIEAAFTAAANRMAIRYQSAAGPSALGRATGQIPDWRREGDNVIRKRTGELEAEHFRTIASDGDLTNHVPIIYEIGEVPEEQDEDDDPYEASATGAGSHAVRMQDLAAGMTRPCAMAVVMGCRTVTPADFADESPSADLLERMKAFGGEPSAEEEAAGGVSLRRYLGFLDASSSTASLGFRVDACKTVFDGELQPLPLPEDLSLETLNDASDVEEAISLFLQGDYSLCKAVLRQLDALQAALGRSAFFASHVLLRSTLLLVYDDAARSKVELKMLNFGNSYAVPAGAAASHAALSWGGTADAHEDGYLAGVRSLAKLLKNLHEKLEISALKGRRLSSAVAGSKGRRLSSMPGNSGSKLSRSDTSNSCGISNLSASVGRKDRKSSSSASAGALTEEDPSPASQASSRGPGGPGSARGAKKLSLSKGPGMRSDELQ